MQNRLLLYSLIVLMSPSIRDESLSSGGGGGWVHNGGEGSDFFFLRSTGDGVGNKLSLEWPITH